MVKVWYITFKMLFSEAILCYQVGSFILLKLHLNSLLLYKVLHLLFQVTLLTKTGIAKINFERFLCKVAKLIIYSHFEYDMLKTVK